MEAQARALADEIRQFHDQEPFHTQSAVTKQRLYSRVGQFLMTTLPLRPSRSHWWCHYPHLMVFMMRILELYPTSESVCLFYQRMKAQLGKCYQCVDTYHASLPNVRVELELEFTPESVTSFFLKLQGLDADRVHSQLIDMFKGGTNASPEIIDTAAITLYEVLHHRRLLSDFRVVRVLSRWIASRYSDVRTNPQLKSLRGCPGLYYLLVSPDSVVREWAKDTVQCFGKIELTGEYEKDQNLLDVLDEWMYILESEEFNKSVLLLDLKTTKDLRDFLEPINSVKTPTKPMLWSALDHVMQRMDINSLEVMLDSFDTIPDVAFNYLQDADPAGDQTLTLMVSKCFAVLLRCLGHRFWNHSVNSSKVVLEAIMQHCRLTTWRVYVTKQFIELLPPLLAAMRPPQISSQVYSHEKLDFYLETRKKILQFLITEDLRLKHYDAVTIIAASRAVFTILADCYEYRMPDTMKNNLGSGRDEGALSESIFIDYSVSESAFWWPCSSGAGDSAHKQLGTLWIDHLFGIVVKPNNVESLVDMAAETTALILSKHLQLARDVVYSSIVASNVGKPATFEAATKGKPIISDLLKKLCSWRIITTIPLQVHGALFESIGGISELLNCVAAQTNASSGQFLQITTMLRNYEDHIQQYLERMCNEVLHKGLANPFRFPVVSQHISACYLSPTNSVDQVIKRLIGQYAVDKKRPTQVPSSLETVLISVHRHAEAFLRGQLSMLQSMRLYGFAPAVCLPAMKKLVFVWSRVFDMLSGDLEKALNKASNGEAMARSSQQVSDTGIAAVHVLKLPNLINEFLIALLTNLFAPKTKLLVEVTETIRVQCLDFGISFWKFWALVLRDPGASSKRVTGLITPLVECIAKGSASENKRAAELLMTVLECLLKGNTRLDEATLALIDSIKGEAASIESKQSTDFGRMTAKFRQLNQSSEFFAKRSTELSSMQDVVNMTAWPKSKLLLRAEPSMTTISASRPMSGKSAARAQARQLVDLTGAEKVSAEAAARRQHSFYSEEEYHINATKAPSKEQTSKPKTSFDMSQVIKGIAQSHPGSNKVIGSERLKKQGDGSPSDQKEEEETEDAGLRFAALFHRIKTTQKPIAICSLLPFYRQLLQLCMPVLLSREFQNERSEKALQVPGLNFKKNADYVRAFLPLMLEECNNEVQEGLQKCSYGNKGHLLRYESEKPREGMRCINFSIVRKDEGLLASSQANFSGKRRPERGGNEKLFRNGDVVLLRISVGNQQQSGFMGEREFLGVILISETEKERRHTTLMKNNMKTEDGEAVKVLFLNDGELDNATASVHSFSTEVLAASAITDTEWQVNPLCNLVTSAREYIALRSVDLLPEHLRTAILTPETYKSTQSDLITITSVLDDLRLSNSNESRASIVKILKRLDKMDVMLTDLRSTSIGKAVNKLRKYDDVQVKTLSEKLKEKWTSLMDKKDVLDRAPHFLSPNLWEAIKSQYNLSQLQSIHSVINNYNMGVSLLQGPPGTGKTKTIMGLLSGLLSLRLPATAVMSITNPKSSSNGSGNSTKGEFNNFEAARYRGVSTEPPGGQPSPQAPASTFSLSGVTSALGSILRRTSDSTVAGPSQTTIQSLKNASSSRSRLEKKLSSCATHSSNPSLVVKRRVISRAALERSAYRTNNILLCAPSNGAVNELVLRIVTDGLLDSSGNVTKVRAPSIHSEALSEEWISIVRLGNAGEDASETVNSVCLPHIIRREMVIHPKAMELHSLQETQRQLRASIHGFHNKIANPDGPKKDRKALAKMHQQLTGCSGRIRRLRDEVTTIRAKMTETILSKASIIACTLSKAGSGDFSGLKHGFDALIIDEAAQAVELSTLVPIRERVARVVLVGDPKQLPATVKSVVAAKARYDRSLFERIAESGVAPSMLRVQYRMHPFLRDFPSKRFYGGMLTDGPSVMERVQKVCPGIYARTSFQPFLFYDVTNSREEDMNGSKYNRVEAAFCVSLCQNMFETCPEVRHNKWSVGFVSPYKEQVRILRQEIIRSGLPSSVGIEVNTVDGFQGREKDVIVFSCVRSSQRGGIGFLRDIRRLNVAITRARFCLYVIGNVATLVRDETWAALIKSARDRKLIIRTEGEDFPTVAKRLTGDTYRELAEHYKLMHEKAAQKSSVKSVMNEPVVMTKPELVMAEEMKGVKANGSMKNDKETCCALKDKGEEANDRKAYNSDTTSLNSVHKESRDDCSESCHEVEQPVDGHKRSAKEAPNAANLKRPRTSPAATTIDPNLSSSYKRGTDSRRDEYAASLKREMQRDEPSRARKHKGSFDRERDDRRNDSINSQYNRYHHNDRRDRDGRTSYTSASRTRTYSRSSSLHASLPVNKAPESVSKKGFYQVHESLPPSLTDRMHSTTPKIRGRPRLSHESAYPPRAPCSSRNRAVSSTSESRGAKSRRSNPSPSSSTSRSTNILGNILGSASNLAKSTSRVNEKTPSRSSEFS